MKREKSKAGSSGGGARKKKGKAAAAVVVVVEEKEKEKEAEVVVAEAEAHGDVMVVPEEKTVVGNSEMEESPEWGAGGGLWNGLVDEQMSWGTFGLYPFLDSELYSKLYSDVVLDDYDIWNLKQIREIPGP